MHCMLTPTQLFGQLFLKWFLITFRKVARFYAGRMWTLFVVGREFHLPCVAPHRFFQKLGDYTSALQFLVLSKCNQEAFVMAEVGACVGGCGLSDYAPPTQAHGQMEEYASVIGDSATTEDYLQIAHHFEQVKNHFKSGLFFMKAKAYKEVCFTALKLPGVLHHLWYSCHCYIVYRLSIICSNARTHCSLRESISNWPLKWSVSVMFEG